MVNLLLSKKLTVHGQKITLHLKDILTAFLELPALMESISHQGITQALFYFGNLRVDSIIFFKS